MTKHTPGDWTFNPKTGDISAPDGQTVGYAASHRREREANGQLFAAGPNMLAELKAIVADIEEQETFSELRGWMLAIKARARTIIAEAESRS